MDNATNVSKVHCVSADLSMYLGMKGHFIAINVILGTVAIIMCLIAVTCLVRLKLLQKVVYRLALYQVLCAMAYGVTFVAQMSAFIAYGHPITGPMCTAVGYAVLYMEWVKLLLTVWSLFHLFCFSVLYRDMKKCEKTYILTTLGVPMLVAIVPLATGSYGQSGAWCWIKNARESVDNCTAEVDVTGVVEQFALWYAPAFVALLMESVLVSVILLKLFVRFSPSNKRVRETKFLIAEEHYKKALAQMLPLMMYPVIFCALVVPPLIYRVYGASGLAPKASLLTVVLFCFSGWSLVAAIALMVHITVVVRYRYQKWKKRQQCIIY